ncbi:hypothetical protein [Flavobacterium zepuense]|nr:hypothetical protein [Flavobacterium zepuense]
MPNNFYIKNQDHFKLYVALKDKINFEALLLSNNIRFHVDDNQAISGSDTRYFLLIQDSGRVNELLRDNNITASTDTIQLVDYDERRKVRMMYYWVLLVVVLLFYIAVIVLE